MKSGDDAFGQALLDWTRGGRDPEIYERDDRFLDIGAGHELFLADYPDWPSSERRAMRYVRGRVIDVGSAAGRVSLYLQQRGFEVVALDSSPLAARVSRMRGVGETWCAPSERLTKSVGSFDTVVLFGNNFGIFGTPDRFAMCSPNGPSGWLQEPGFWPRAPIPTAVGLPPSIGVSTFGTKSMA